MPRVDVAIAGAGIIGLTIATELLRTRPDLSVIIFDKETQLGQHASGRNSGVIHAGFYYAPDSLKAQLTRRGNQLMHQFLDECGVPIRRCGKVVVAQESTELEALTQLHQRAGANGVPTELVDEAGLREIEPAARTVGRALWSPTTSVADPQLALAALAARVSAQGGEIRLGQAVTAATKNEVDAGGQNWSVGHFVNASGLQADRVANWFGMCDDYIVLPFKGLYRYASRRFARPRCHVYPVPDRRNPFLGVHVTVSVDGTIKVGPTAIPALSREEYAGLAGFAARDVAQTLRYFPSLLRSRHHNALRLTLEELPKYRRGKIVSQAARLVPGLKSNDFAIKGRPGIRAQLFHLPTRRLEMDFVIRGDKYSTHVLNAVSPAWTSSLAVAEHIVADLSKRAAI